MPFVRDEHPDDIPGIRRVNELAFDRGAEADLVDFLRTRGKLLVSLVAVDDARVVGHIAFSPVQILGACHTAGSQAVPDAPGPTPSPSGVGLGPMAVLPELQRRGIGSCLVREGLARVARLGLDYAVLLGHPRFYPRFGFVPAVTFDLRCAWPVPDEAFMALEIRPGALRGHSGMVLFVPEYDDV